MTSFALEKAVDQVVAVSKVIGSGDKARSGSSPGGVKGAGGADVAVGDNGSSVTSGDGYREYGTPDIDDLVLCMCDISGSGLAGSARKSSCIIGEGGTGPYRSNGLVPGCGNLSM